MYQELSLTLLVLCDFTDHANLAVTVNDLALVANLLYGCTNLHCFASSSSCPSRA